MSSIFPPVWSLGPHSQRLRTACLLVLSSSGTLVLDLSDFLELLVLLSSNPLSLFSSNNLNLGYFLVSSNPPLSKTTWLIFPRFSYFQDHSKCYPTSAEALGPLVLCSSRSIVILSSGFLILSVWPRPLILWFRRLSSDPLTFKICNFLPSWPFLDILEMESFIPQVSGPQSSCPALFSRDENWSSWINAKTTFCGASGNVPDRGENFFEVQEMLEKNSLEMIRVVAPSNALFKKSLLFSNTQ